MVPIVERISTAISTSSSPAIVKLKAASPTIMVGVGIAGVVAGTVMACKATLKADDILDEMAAEVEKVNTVHENTSEERYSEKDYQKDMTIVYARGGAKLAKLYAPAIIILGLSIASILCGHNILRKRNLALGAAYAALDRGFSDYRNRVKEDLGEDADRKYKYGLKEEVLGTEEFVDDNGKKHKQKIKGYSSDGVLSPYARFFDNTCETWDDNPYYNEVYLIGKQKEANETLRRRGYLTLNEVYTMLDIPTMDAGLVVGWIYDPHYNPAEHNNKDQVDFGIFDMRNSAAINGVEPVYILDFNVQGDIYHSFRNKFAV